ncbi:MAG TPA: NAD-dependent epimerase/dehydratase family protein [Rubrobacter sp.]|nr:NAD-dependent epimerase/dehydratase family protein [Rubrobacter sp.]
MRASKVLITGGKGTLGSRVVERLRDAGGNVRVMSRSRRPDTVRGDLATGEGVDAIVDHAEC